MKFLALLLLVASASAAGIRAGYQNDGTEVADVERQQDVLNMLYKMYEPLRERFSKLQTAANEYDPTKHTDDFTDDGKAAIELCRRYEHGELLAKKEIFSLFNDRHREQAILLFDALIFSKDWQTFISNAAYYREKVNEGVFVYAFYTAIIHSNHALNVVAPPLYEIMPHFFATSDVIHRAYEAKMKQQAGVFQLNFTGSLRNPEQHVAYFGEDIGLNVHHVTWHMDFPFWWKDGQYSHHLDRKGELFFWAHHQLNARYDAERLSNGLNFVDELDWNKPIHEGFAPHITYKYGGAFPSRADDSVFQDVDGIVTVREVETYENRIRDAIDHGYVVDREGKKVDIRGKDGIEIIGDILESSENSVNVPYYGSLHNLAHIILGRQGDPHQKYDLPPSVMEHFETATRDPAFFRLHKHLDNIFKQHKDSLPSYKSEEMEFVGVTLDNVEVDKELVTFFEEFKFDLLMAVDDTEEIDDVPMSAQTKRINHEDFSLKMTLTNNADKKVPATFRIFLMPMHDNNGVELDMNEQGWGAIELDKFWSYLTPGSNTVERKSSEASTTVPDPFSYAQIQEFASKGDLSKLERSCGIPNRFLLPKGKPEGLEFELVVVVTDAEKDGFVGKFEDEIGTTHTQCGTHGQKYPEERPLGYPFDRYIPDKEDFFAIPNMLKKTVIITHHTHHEHHH